MLGLGDFSGQHFPAFRLNTDTYSVNLYGHSECRKSWSRKQNKSNGKEIKTQI